MIKVLFENHHLYYLPNFIPIIDVMIKRMDYDIYASIPAMMPEGEKNIFTNALKKIAPELTPLLDQAGTAEENVIIPVSVVKNFAAKRYGGEDETQAITSFIADLQESAPGMSNEMEQTNVPPDTQMAEQPESGMEQVFNAIDTEGEIV